MIVCHCSVVSDRRVSAAVDNGARTLGEVCQSTGAGKDCGACVFSVKRLISEAAGRPCPAYGDPYVANVAEVAEVAGVRVVAG